MKKLSLLGLFVILFGILGCSSNKFKAEFNDKLINKILIGETIDFNKYIDVDDGVEVTLSYILPGKSETKHSSLRFVTNQVAMHTFNLTCSKDNTLKVLTCKIDVVPKAPSIVSTGNSVFANKDDIVNFDDIYANSNFDVIPYGQFEYKFESVDFYQDYAKEDIVLNASAKTPVHSEIEDTVTSYKFTQFGKYIFNVLIFNSEGSVKSTIQVSVFNDGEQIDGVIKSGVINGTETNVVEVLKSRSIDNASYLYYEDPLKMETGKKYTMSAVFYGKQAPLMILNADRPNGFLYSDKGYIVSLEENENTGLGIYGDERLNSSNKAPSRGSGDTFSRKTLTGDSKYKWNLTFYKTVQNDGVTTNLNIESELFKDDLSIRKYKKATISNVDLSNNGYFGFMGSKHGDIIFKFSQLNVEDL